MFQNKMRLSIIFLLLNLCVTKCFDFKLGLENIPNNLEEQLTTKRLGIGIITNQTGLDQNGNRNIDILLSKGFNIKEIFVPEHGLSGQILAEKQIEDSYDIKTNLPVISLYLGDSKLKKFEEKDLENIDAFIFDIQDSGTRHYTYISILYKMMEVASRFNKKIIVLDRPNPLGYIMEGPLVDEGLESFVSIASIPLRHAMTVGELAKYFQKFCINKPVDLTLVPMKNYKRTRGLNGKLDIFLSPNIRNINACQNYSFLGILDSLLPFNVLKNTQHAFDCLMLPISIDISDNQWNQLIEILCKNNISSEIFEFQNNQENFKGLKLKVNNINEFSSFNTLLDILDFFKNLKIKFEYSKIFNKLAGTYKLYNYIEGYISRKDLADKVNNELKVFYHKTEDLLLYSPKIVMKSTGPRIF